MFGSNLYITVRRILNLLTLLYLTPPRWINSVRGSFFLPCCRMKTVTMLRRRSEFFVFLDSVRSVRSEKEEQKEELQLSPYEEYLQVLLQMKMTSAVSAQRNKIIPEELFFPFKHTVSLVNRLSVVNTIVQYDKRRVCFVKSRPR